MREQAVWMSSGAVFDEVCIFRHEHDAVKMRQALTAVRDIKGVSRLVRGTTAQVQNQTSHLLGQVDVNVKVRQRFHMTFFIVCFTK